MGGGGGHGVVNARTSFGWVVVGVGFRKNGLVRRRASRAGSRPGGFERAHRLDQVLVEAPLERFQAAPLRIGQIGGESERAQVRQNLAEVLEPPLQPGGARREHGRRVRLQNASRVREDRPAVRLVRNPVGRHEHLGIGGAELVREHGREHQVLVGRCQRGERVRRRCPEAPGRQFLAGPGRQPGRQLEAAGHPVRLLGQEVRDGARREVVLGEE